MDRQSALAFARSDVSTLPLYAPDATPCAIDLSDNTNLWGAPPAALDAIRSAECASVSRYPALYSEPLRDLLLRHVGLGQDSACDVITGCGSDDVLDSAMRAFSVSGASLAYSTPTFSMIPVLARLTGLRPAPIPFAENFDIDAERLVDTHAEVTYVCTPNNPTATIASRTAVEYVVRNATGIVILDEAYAEFAPETFVDLLEENERLLITRTFSKAFGLAGLRVGFGVGSSEITRLVARARGPYKVNALAERAVHAALSSHVGGRDWVATHAALVIENRNRLVAELAQRGLTALPSFANFVLVPSPDALRVSRELATRGILVRVITGLPEVPTALGNAKGTALRIGVGPWDMMRELLTALDEAI
jgi:histidinol-phosphate aminotransferase